MSRYPALISFTLRTADDRQNSAQTHTACYCALAASVLSCKPPPSARYRSMAFVSRASRLHQRLVRAEQFTLRIQHFERSWRHRCVAQFGQLQALRLRSQTLVLGVDLLVERAARDQGVRDFAETRSGSSFRSWRRRGLLRTSPGQVAAIAARVENRQQQRRCEGPGARATVEQAGQFVLAVPIRGGQRDAWEERRARRADVGIGRRSRCSAGRMSGRRVSSSDGAPAGMSVTRSGSTGSVAGAARRAACRPGGQRILGLRLLPREGDVGYARRFAPAFRRGADRGPRRRRPRSALAPVRRRCRRPLQRLLRQRHAVRP